jgi:hypothetical protein
MATILDAAKSLLNPRARLVKQLADLRATHERDGAARATALAAARKRRDEWESPKREVERLEAAAFQAGLVADRERAELQAALRARPAPALLAFNKFLDRVAAELREPARVIEKVNRLTGERTITSDDDGARMRGGAVLVRARVEARDTLPFVDDAELLRRVASLKGELLAALDGVDGAELGDEP